MNAIDPTKPTRPRTTRATREHAYYLWAHVAHRNCTEIGRILDLHPRVVQRWAQAGDWPDRYARELVIMHPEHATQIVGNLTVGLPRATHRLRLIVEDPASTNWDIVQATRAMVDAAVRLGIDITGRARDGAPSFADRGAELARLSDAELLALEEGTA